MSPDGQAPEPAPSAVLVGEFHLPRGRWFDWHHHPDHQLAWAASGVLQVRVDDRRTWVLPPSFALWLPAGTTHATGSAAVTTIRSLYFRPEFCPPRWSRPTVVAVPGLLRELIGHLGRADLAGAARRRAEELLLDLPEPVRMTAISVPEPADDRLRRIAAALSADPADDRTLSDWGRIAGASARNLARLFRAETGLTFGQWRTQLRLRAALPLLAEGVPVSRVAGRVGYASPSGFVAAFHRVVGVSPGAYFG